MADVPTLFLVTTCDPERPGSMQRYADLLESTMEHAGVGLRVRRVDLAPTHQQLNRWPQVLQDRVRHLLILQNARRLRRTVAGSLVHLLDGSYGYVLHALSSPHTIVTCHDLIPFRQCRGEWGARPGWPARQLIARSCTGLTHAAAVITDCQAVGQQVCTLAGVAADRVSLVHIPLALDVPMLAPGVYERHHLLHVGNDAFYKNRPAVLRIFSWLAPQWSGRLVMAGAPADAALRQLAQSLGLADRVEFVENPDDEALRTLYRTARVFLFPSLVEGYGWPPLEAVAAGCPVVASDVGGIREVLGDEGGWWFDPADEAGMAAACLEVLHQPEMALARVKSGQAALTNLTPARMARSLLDVYQKVLACDL